MPRRLAVSLVKSFVVGLRGRGKRKGAGREKDPPFINIYIFFFLFCPSACLRELSLCPEAGRIR